MEYFEVITDAKTGKQTIRPLTPEETAAMQGTAKEQKDRIRAARAAAYTAEADPLFFKWQAGESTQADWLAKRAEIRARYPYPDEAQ